MVCQVADTEATLSYLMNGRLICRLRFCLPAHTDYCHPLLPSGKTSPFFPSSAVFYSNLAQFNSLSPCVEASNEAHCDIFPSNENKDGVDAIPSKNTPARANAVQPMFSPFISSSWGFASIRMHCLGGLKIGELLLHTMNAV
ncbi:unnamed protein product [Protopolystoma xenopodis]|uniref:Uncharacterized protein n=1 Tax=Protopolystoma xenopodis TaxID=117903 RepID=A0A3S5BK15_9PLAT|nr:unnamed protein product [Protopolystoma xenopodis]